MKKRYVLRDLDRPSCFFRVWKEVRDNRRRKNVVFFCNEGHKWSNFVTNGNRRRKNGWFFCVASTTGHKVMLRASRHYFSKAQINKNPYGWCIALPFKFTRVLHEIVWFMYNPSSKWGIKPDKLSGCYMKTLKSCSTRLIAGYTAPCLLPSAANPNPPALLHHFIPRHITSIRDLSGRFRVMNPNPPQKVLPMMPLQL